jgi:Glyoxalase-like domain
MTHHSRVAKVVIDVDGEDHDATLDFWSGAIGREFGRMPLFPEYHGAGLTGCGDMSILVQRLADGPARMHLDIHTDDRPAEVDRLRKLGAVVDNETDRWTVMRDPAGLLFCVISDPPDRHDDTNSTRWD